MLDPKALAKSVSTATAAPARVHGVANWVEDGWANISTGLGVVGKDKRLDAIADPCPLAYADLANLYSGSDIAQNIVDIPAGEMTREWADLKIEGDEEAAEKTGKAVDALKMKERMIEALRWQRLYGGSVIFIGLNDGVTDLSQPVDEKRIQSVDFLNAFDAREARVLEWETNPLAKDFSKPKIWGIFPQVWGQGALPLLQRVHASRICHFTGVLPNRVRQIANFGHGDSILIRCYEAIRDFSTSYGGAAALLQDFSQAVFKMNGLAGIMASDKEGLVKQRLALMDFARSMIGAVILDAENEEFKRETTQVAGLSDLLDSMGARLSAAARMPQIMLFGDTPGGIGDKGGVNLEIYHKQIAMDQETSLTPAYLKIARYVQASKAGPTRGKIYEDACLEWRALSELSDEEKATRNLTQAQADQIYVTLGVVTAEEIQRSRFKGDHYSLETEVDDVETAPADPSATVPRIDPTTGQPVEVKPGQTPEKAPAAPVGVAGKPIPGATAGAAPKAADSAMSGQQATFALSIVQEVNNKQISPAQGKALLVALLYMDPAEADSIIAEPFEPKPPEPSPDTVAKLAVAAKTPPAPAKK